MARLFDILWEGNVVSGSGGLNGTTVGGGMSIESAAPIKGLYSLKSDGTVGSYGVQTLTATDTLFVSCYVRFPSAPAATANVIFLRSPVPAALISIRIRTTPGFALFTAAGVQIGSTYVATAGTVYRVGMQYVKGTGANAIARMWVAVGDAAFSVTPDAESLSQPDTAQAATVRVGAPGSAGVVAFFDNLRLDDAAMPTDDVAVTTVALLATARSRSGVQTAPALMRALSGQARIMAQAAVVGAVGRSLAGTARSVARGLAAPSIVRIMTAQAQTRLASSAAASRLTNLTAQAQGRAQSAAGLAISLLLELTAQSRVRSVPFSTAAQVRSLQAQGRAAARSATTPQVARLLIASDRVRTQATSALARSALLVAMSATRTNATSTLGLARGLAAQSFILARTASELQVAAASGAVVWLSGSVSATRPTASTLAVALRAAGALTATVPVGVLALATPLSGVVTSAARPQGSVYAHP